MGKRKPTQIARPIGLLGTKNRKLFMTTLTRRNFNRPEVSTLPITKTVARDTAYRRCVSVSQTRLLLTEGEVVTNQGSFGTLDSSKSMCAPE